MADDVLIRIAISVGGVSVILLLIAYLLSVLARQDQDSPHFYSTGQSHSRCSGESCNRAGRYCAICEEGQ